MFSKFISKTGIVAGISMITGPLAFAPTAAMAATTCPSTTPAATVVAPGVCQVKFTSDASFTIPSGITKLSALIVGGGAAGSQNDQSSYGGGGGAVVYVDQVDLTAPAAIVVGHGGTTASLAGTASSVNADSAAGGDGVISGNQNAGGYADNNVTCHLVDGYTGFFFTGAGGGAKTAADAETPGTGYVPSDSDLNVDTSLWPVIAAEVEYGVGGAVCQDAAFPANSGHGGNGPFADASWNIDYTKTYGADGVVLLRFAPAAAPKSNLADTGANLGWFGLAGALMAIAGVAIRRRADQN